MKMGVFTFSGWVKMIEKLSIYRLENSVNLETINGPMKWHDRLANQLGTANNRILFSKMFGLDRELLPIIKRPS